MGGGDGDDASGIWSGGGGGGGGSAVWVTADGLLQESAAAVGGLFEGMRRARGRASASVAALRSAAEAGRNAVEELTR